MDYSELLAKARSELPEKEISGERFEVPKVRGHIQGNRTVITNFYQISNAIGRDAKEFLRVLLKELAAPGDLKAKALILGSKISASRVNEKINEYVEKYVLCKECGKPDTKLSKEGNITFLRCTACGAKHAVV